MIHILTHFGHTVLTTIPPPLSFLPLSRSHTNTEANILYHLLPSFVQFSPNRPTVRRSCACIGISRHIFSHFLLRLKIVNEHHLFHSTRFDTCLCVSLPLSASCIALEHTRLCDYAMRPLVKRYSMEQPKRNENLYALNRNETGGKLQSHTSHYIYDHWLVATSRF